MSKTSLERSGWNWAPLPADVILSPDLTHADVRVYAYLLWRSGKKEHSWPSVQTIADDLHMGFSTAKLSLKHLVEQGWINRKRQLMRSSVTYINEIPFPRSANLLADVGLTGEPKDGYPVSRLNESNINESKRTFSAKPTRQPSPQNPLYPIAKALSEVCAMDMRSNSGRLFREAKLLSAATPAPTPELIHANYNGSGFWAERDWRGKKGQRPTPALVRETWGQWVEESTAIIAPDDVAAEYARLNRRKNV